MKSEESTVNLMVTLYVCVTFITCYIVRSKNPLFAELNTIIQADSLVSSRSCHCRCCVCVMVSGSHLFWHCSFGIVCFSQGFHRQQQQHQSMPQLVGTNEASLAALLIATQFQLRVLIFASISNKDEVRFACTLIGNFLLR